MFHAPAVPHCPRKIAGAGCVCSLSPNQSLWPLLVTGDKGRTGAPFPHPHRHPAQETKLCSLGPTPPSVTSSAHTAIVCRMSSSPPGTLKRLWWGVGDEAGKDQEGPAGGEGISLGNELAKASSQNEQGPRELRAWTRTSTHACPGLSLPVCGTSWL